MLCLKHSYSRNQRAHPVITDILSFPLSVTNATARPESISYQYRNQRELDDTVTPESTATTSKCSSRVSEQDAWWIMRYLTSGDLQRPSMTLAPAAPSKAGVHPPRVGTYTNSLLVSLFILSLPLSKLKP